MRNVEQIKQELDQCRKELIAAKAEDAGKKIMTNSSFGKFGNRWSKLYSPGMLINVTLTGQLSLLMLIETLESEGIPVVSANTDGVVIKCPRDKEVLMNLIMWEWEQLTGFETEETRYKALYAKDVNNYIALKGDGKIKLKGLYAPAGLSKNPTNEICVKAVIAYLAKGESVERTIRSCDDIRQFITVRQVKGGAVWNNQYLGRVVRWYYAGLPGAIHYKVNGYTVARTEGARPVMTLPDSLPKDIDYEWYINEAHSILEDIGVKNDLLSTMVA